MSLSVRIVLTIDVIYSAREQHAGLLPKRFPKRVGVAAQPLSLVGRWPKAPTLKSLGTDHRPGPAENLARREKDEHAAEPACVPAWGDATGAFQEFTLRRCI